MNLENIDIKELKKYAQWGSPLAQDKLGFMMVNADKGGTDMEEAFSQFERASKQDMPSAYYHLACFYELGWGKCDINTKSARELYYEAAVRGDGQAQSNLGALIAREAEGEKENLKEAARWFKRAADNKVEDGINNLNNCINNGVITKKELNKDDFVPINWEANTVKLNDTVTVSLPDNFILSRETKEKTCIRFLLGDGKGTFKDETEGYIKVVEVSDADIEKIILNLNKSESLKLIDKDLTSKYFLCTASEGGVAITSYICQISDCEFLNITIEHSKKCNSSKAASEVQKIKDMIAVGDAAIVKRSVRGTFSFEKKM